MACEALCLFGKASGPDGRAFCYKILANKSPARDYQLVLEVTNGLSSYIAKFTLSDLLTAAEKFNVMPEAEDMIGWLQEQFDDKAVEAHLDGVGALQLSAVQTVGDLSITISLPPDGPVAPLPDARSTGWVIQDVLFSTEEALHEAKNKLDACEQRCPAAQQLEDALAFLAAQRQGQGGSSANHASPPRVSLLKRKQPEPEVELAAGSAVKAARGDAGGAAPMAAAGPVEPTSTQPTGGVSTHSRRTEISVSLQPKRITGRKPMPGRGRGSKAGGLKVGKARN